MNFLFIIFWIVVGCDYRADIRELRYLKAQCVDVENGLKELGPIKVPTHYIKAKLDECKAQGFIEEVK
jgi:hypothetical protein